MCGDNVNGGGNGGFEEIMILIMMVDCGDPHNHFSRHFQISQFSLPVIVCEKLFFFSLSSFVFLQITHF